MNPKIILIIWLLSVMLLSSGCFYDGRGYESRPHYYDDYYDPLHPYYVPEERRGEHRERFHEEQRDERGGEREREERGGRGFGGEERSRGEHGGGNRGGFEQER